MMITSSFKLIPPIQTSDTFQKVKESGSIQRLESIQNGWEFGVVFPDFEAARGFFGFLFDRNIDLDIHWMVKDRNPYNEPHSSSKTISTT